MYKPDAEAIICENCHRTCVYPALPDDYFEAPFFTLAGEAWCSESCLYLWSADREQSWRDFIELDVAKRRGVEIDEDDDIPGESRE